MKITFFTHLLLLIILFAVPAKAQQTFLFENFFVYLFINKKYKTCI